MSLRKIREMVTDGGGHVYRTLDGCYSLEASGEDSDPVYLRKRGRMWEIVERDGSLMCEAPTLRAMLDHIRILFSRNPTGLD